jgi:hypothetical protein
MVAEDGYQNLGKITDFYISEISDQEAELGTPPEF